MSKKRHILVTGADGFIGKNLIFHLRESARDEVLSFVRHDTNDNLRESILKADAIFHLAGVNRPVNVKSFAAVNTELTRTVCDMIRSSKRNIPLIFTSSSQATQDSPYGKSKFDAEREIINLSAEKTNSSVIYRLPGVFGKWCKPNYNSVVATYCYNISRGLPIQIDDPSVNLELVYIDDVIDSFLRVLDYPQPGISWVNIDYIYKITLGDLADQIFAFKNCRSSLISEFVGTGLVRALYSTYLSYLPSDNFIYDIPKYDDSRGIFVEMLKTKNSGQLSFFTVHPGLTRGSHYHHSKTEKFLVAKGLVRMRFRHLVNGETCQFVVSSNKPQVIDSIPGWVHEITNIGDCEAIVLLWANEIFDRQHPDCIPCEV